VICGFSDPADRLARQLREPLHALHVRSDVERKRLAGLAPEADSRSPPDAGIYTPEYTARTYDRLHDCAAAALGGGESILVDAAFLRSDERLRFLLLAESLGARAAIVHCFAPAEVLRDRVAARSTARNDASEAGLDVLQRQPSWWEDFGDRERRTWSSGLSGDTPLAAALGQLQPGLNAAQDCGSFSTRRCRQPVEHCLDRVADKPSIEAPAAPTISPIRSLPNRGSRAPGCPPGDARARRAARDRSSGSGMRPMRIRRWPPPAAPRRRQCTRRRRP
jgi:predicted kinase